MNTPSVNQNILESKRIAQFLASLPDERLLLLTKTTDQRQYWLSTRSVWRMVARAWWARVRGEDDPLRSLVQSKELCQNDYNRVWQLVECHQRLWALVQFTEPFVRDEFERLKLPYTFSSSYDLFICIVQEQVNAEFAYCLHSYKEFSAKKEISQYRELASCIRDGFPSPQTAQTPIPASFSNKIEPVFWSLFLMFIAHQKASKSKHRALRKALESYEASIADLFELEASYARRTGSFAWINGEKRKGSRYGGTYEENP